MKIKEFIEFLQKYPQDYQVAYRMYSEQCLLDWKDITVIVACAPRPDGWIQDARDDEEAQLYLLLPGN